MNSLPYPHTEPSVSIAGRIRAIGAYSLLTITSVFGFITGFQDFLKQTEVRNLDKARQCADSDCTDEERECLTWARSAHDARILLGQYVDNLLSQ